MRQLTPYEFNQCQKYGIDPSNITDEYLPIEYITGRATFYHHDFIIDQNVLIPRIESEEIISLAQKHIKKKDRQDITIADIGTGSGCLGISLHLIYPQIDIYLSDISPLSLAVAQKNVNLFCPESKNIHLIKSNLLSNYPPQQKIDLIIANLPYIPSTNINSLSPSVKHEPILALDGGSDGLAVIDRLLTTAPKHLNPRGNIIIEIDDTHRPEDFQKYQKQYSITYHQDQFHKLRFIQLELIS